MRLDLALVAVADAAPDNWSFLSKLDPEAEAVDFRRACEHLGAVAAHARDPDAWFRRWRDELKVRRGGVDRVIRSIRHLRNSRAPAAPIWSAS
ncbi:MAG: hypothetical protein OXI01_05890 [Albidovulum sp.]|nr:hypothetical protein [Albidovulum sp.]